MNRHAVPRGSYGSYTEREERLRERVTFLPQHVVRRMRAPALTLAVLGVALRQRAGKLSFARARVAARAAPLLLERR